MFKSAVSGTGSIYWAMIPPTFLEKHDILEHCVHIFVLSCTAMGIEFPKPCSMFFFWRRFVKVLLRAVNYLNSQAKQTVQKAVL